jgi:hypothetical protein
MSADNERPIAADNEVTNPADNDVTIHNVRV